jgi:hypothetical protein
LGTKSLRHGRRGKLGKSLITTERANRRWPLDRRLSASAHDRLALDQTGTSVQGERAQKTQDQAHAWNTKPRGVPGGFREAAHRAQNLPRDWVSKCPRRLAWVWGLSIRRYAMRCERLLLSCACAEPPKPWFPRRCARQQPVRCHTCRRRGLSQRSCYSEIALMCHPIRSRSTNGLGRPSLEGVTLGRVGQGDGLRHGAPSRAWAVGGKIRIRRIGCPAHISR